MREEVEKWKKTSDSKDKTITELREEVEKGKKISDSKDKEIAGLRGCMKKDKAGLQVNAFCLPGGKIVVYTGILDVAKTEAGLATVMGHEMAHATARHGSERLVKQQATQTLMAGVQFSLGDMSYEQRRVVMGALGAGAQFGILLPFGREHESEADAIGLTYMARAGYDPREAVAFWERMARSSGAGKAPPELLSTHPSHGTRVERLKVLMPKALEIYNASDRRD